MSPAILITGAAGFLGAEILRQLVNKKDIGKIYSLSRGHYPALGVEHLPFDLSSSETSTLVQFLKQHQIETIIHTAAKAGVWGRAREYWQTNYQGTLHLLQAATQAGVRHIIYTSTPSVVFGRESIEYQSEEQLSYPKTGDFLTSYAASKAAAEAAVLALNGQLNSAGLPMYTLAIRPHLIWGPGDPHLLPRLVQAAAKGRLIQVGSGQTLVDVVHVANAAKAHLLALEALQERPEEVAGLSYFIGQERPVPLWPFLEKLISAATGRSWQVSRGISLPAAYAIGACFEWVGRLVNLVFPHWEPPMTRFVALQLGKSHYFNQHRAWNKLFYRPQLSIDEGLAQIANSIKNNENSTTTLRP